MSVKLHSVVKYHGSDYYNIGRQLLVTEVADDGTLTLGQSGGVHGTRLVGVSPENVTEVPADVKVLTVFSHYRPGGVHYKG